MFRTNNSLLYHHVTPYCIGSNSREYHMNPVSKDCSCFHDLNLEFGRCHNATIAADAFNPSKLYVLLRNNANRICIKIQKRNTYMIRIFEHTKIRKEE